MKLLDKIVNFAYERYYAYKLAQDGKFGELIESKSKDIQVFMKGYNTRHRHIVSFKNKRLFKIIDLEKTDMQRITSLNFMTGRVFKSTIESNSFERTRTLRRRMYELLPNRQAGLQLGRNQNMTFKNNGNRWDKI